MRTALKILFALTIIFSSASCRREDPQSVISSPVFYFTGTVGSAVVNMHAGENNYYMYSSHTQDVYGIYNFTGDLHVYNCTSCGNGIKITINDFQPSVPNGNAAINTSLSPGHYAYKIPGGAPTEFNVQFYSAPQNGTASSYLWDFGDGIISTTQNPLHTYARPGKYLVSNSVTFTNTTVSVSSYLVNVGIPDAACSAAFGSSVTGTTVLFTPAVSGQAPFTYQWDFGDGNNSSAANPSHTYAVNGVYSVHLIVTDANNHICELVRNVATQSFTGSYSYFYFSPAITTNPNPRAFSNVTVEWTDASGTIYSSDNSAQSAFNYFKLVAADSYDNNQNGETTKKLHVYFNCKVYSATDSLQINNGEAVMAVSYQ
ncbi:MAG: PKD domain-containing protein [Bacteroidetes bacterium]|nr:PKD domain-containing protein [Bacteroidota bacterium]